MSASAPTTDLPPQETAEAPAETPRFRKLFRYLVNTGLSFVVNLGLTALLHEAFGVREATSYAVALVTVFVMNFLLFRYYVFDGRTDQPGKQLATFAGTSVVFRVSEWFVFRLLHEKLGVYYLLAIILVQGTTFVIKYFVYGGWLFNRKAKAEPAEA
ncbi:GtrA family protein [Algisphaera agarilytica]|uniref:Putative flippase GtrA n=1 Tax=Algisphaera agarilytica TaxID=1385975 RepID=A0A7X0LL00_9BACT|nr:GtrA family protein [Algisphaera agarilytica]MBB6430980.1 putative flippase GtrA [Algisphaera agarilytica]